MFVIFTFTDIAIASDIVDVGFSVPFQLFTYNGEIILWNGYDENGYDKQIVFEKILYDVEKEQRDYTGEVDEFYKTRLRSGV